MTRQTEVMESATALTNIREILCTSPSAPAGECNKSARETAVIQEPLTTTATATATATATERPVPSTARKTITYSEYLQREANRKRSAEDILLEAEIEAKMATQEKAVNPDYWFSNEYLRESGVTTESETALDDEVAQEMELDRIGAKAFCRKALYSEEAVREGLQEARWEKASRESYSAAPGDTAETSEADLDKLHESIFGSRKAVHS